MQAQSYNHATICSPEESLRRFLHKNRRFLMEDRLFLLESITHPRQPDYPVYDVQDNDGITPSPLTPKMNPEAKAGEAFLQH